MNTPKIDLKHGTVLNRSARGAAPVLIVYFLWQLLPYILTEINPTVGLLDESVWQLLLFAIVCFLLMLALCLLLFSLFLAGSGLPLISTLVSQFKTLNLWQQIILYWASFALLLLGAVCSLAAVF
jgi:hypothetical protein